MTTTYIKLYQKDQTGKVRYWYMEQDSNKYRSISGIRGRENTSEQVFSNLKAAFLRRKLYNYTYISYRSLSHKRLNDFTVIITSFLLFVNTFNYLQTTQQETAHKKSRPIGRLLIFNKN